MDSDSIWIVQGNSSLLDPSTNIVLTSNFYMFEYFENFVIIKEGGLDSINIVIKSPLFYITLVFDQQVYCFSLSTYLTSLQFSLSMNYHLHCFSINMVFNQHCFRSTLLIICIKFSQHIKTSQLLFNL